MVIKIEFTIYPFFQLQYFTLLKGFKKTQNEGSMV